MPLSIHSYPRALLHIDGDAFFASCEQSRNPAWRGRPVICGKERGIAASMSYEAKARGVTRAMRLSEILRLCPDAIILPSDYETYSLLSKRFFAIVRRYTSEVEENGIDECFADITGLRSVYHSSYEKIAQEIKKAIDAELGFTFSVGLAPTKVLAKIASNYKKPSGFTAIPAREAHLFLKNLPTQKIWGIGPATSALLSKLGKHTALDFASANEQWVKHNLTKPIYEIWQELNGKPVYNLNLEAKSDYASIQKTKTFTPSSNDRNFVFSQLSKNVENALIKARRYHLAASEAYIFVKTQDFNYYGVELKFSQATSVPMDIIKNAEEVFDKIFSKRKQYRATGIILTKLGAENRQPDLFGSFLKVEKFMKIYKGIDELSARYGKHTLFLGTSFEAQKFGAHLGQRGDEPERKKQMLLGESKRRRLGIPMWLGAVG
ncbi:MAG: DNA polymerase IV [Patescibacteria group bacterium]|jgi:DNA polymerase-4/DNA polymerase V